MLYTIDQINPNLSSTAGFTIGAHILDDCDKDTYGLEQAVAFIKGIEVNISKPIFKLWTELGTLVFRYYILVFKHEFITCS